MSHLIGRGRTARETYPQSPAAGGASGAGAPLSRQRFIDGDTVQGGLTGAAVAPFATIAQFMAARGNSSVEDAQTNFVGWLTPASPTGYVEDVDFVPYASTELRAPAEGGVIGVTIVGDVRWDNLAGANTPPAAAVVLHNVGIVAGSFVVTDDPGAPPSTIVISSDSGAVGIPAFDSSATTELTSVLFKGIVVGAVNALNVGSPADSAAVSFLNSQVTGNVSALSVGAEGTLFGGGVSTIEVNDNANFINCRFTIGSDPVLTAPNGAVFDGLSWQSFVEAGGTKAAGTVVTVIGGYNGAAVEGVDLNATPISVSLNGANATAGFEDGGNHYTVPSGETTPAVVILLTDGALDGDTLLISKQGTDANAIDVQDSGASTVGTIPANERGFVLARFSATTGDWVFDQGGSLAA